MADGLLDWIRLIRTENVGPVTFHQLIKRFGSAGEALHHLPALAQKGGRKKKIEIPTRSYAEEEVKAAEKIGGVILRSQDDNYPALLKEIYDAPPILHSLGHPHLAHEKTIAFVGARNASTNGVRLTHNLAKELGQAGYIIVSGLARGIDSSAHQASLATGTIAVLAGGVDVIYPRENEKLYAAIKEQGLILSENIIGTEPQARHFPRRNRIISGLSRATLIIEAAKKSGSLITAKFAADQGRDVMAVPGSPLDPRCQGTNALIKDGAILVQSAQDILDALQNFAPRIMKEQGRFFEEAEPLPDFDDENLLAKARQALPEYLSFTPIEINELSRVSDLPLPTILAVLLEMELAGKIERSAGNQVCLLTSLDESLTA